MLKARIKRVQRELSQQRMLGDVGSATVVLTNPTHYAIALKYDLHSMTAPKVVAKGVDEVAKRIREIADEHDVPILERRELARALYRTVEVGDDIPPALYHAIAEIVAYLYRIGKFRAAG
jgi:flagellar biosynthetic protein FlhB